MFGFYNNKKIIIANLRGKIIEAIKKLRKFVDEKFHARKNRKPKRQKFQRRD